jgi:hypothetical protein
VTFALDIKRLAVCLVAGLVFLPVSARVQQQDPPGVAEFRAAIERYLGLHRRLKAEVPTLAVTADEREISDASDTLAGAVQRARRDAKPGDIFNPEVTRVITVRLKGALEGENVKHFIARINDEPTLKGPPRIHMRYPAGSSMARMPTRVLDALPALPVELEYRLLGRALILRDRDAALIVDYIGEAFPGER